MNREAQVYTLAVSLWQASHDADSLAKDAPFRLDEAAFLGLELGRLLRALARLHVYPLDTHGVVSCPHPNQHERSL